MSGSLHEAVSAYAVALAPEVARTVSQARSLVPAFDARWGCLLYTSRCV